MPEKNAKSYLGDGAYVQVGQFAGEVVLTTENGRFVGNTVILDEQGTLKLIEWLQQRGWKIRLGRNEPETIAIQRVIIREVDDA